MQPGFYPDMSENIYHGLEGYSKSVLCAVTPFDYWANRIYSGSKPDEKGKDYFVQGSLFHCMLLEKSEVYKRYTKNENLNGDGKAIRKGTKAYAKWAEENPGKTLVSAKIWEECERMELMAFMNPLVKQLMTVPGYAESSFIAQCPITGAYIRCRPDYLHKTESMLPVDLKTTGDFKASPAKFPWEAYQYHYHVSAAFTLDIIEIVTGKRPDQYLFISVEKKWPHRSAVWKATEKGLAVGREYYQNRLKLLSLCKKSGYYPSYTRGGKSKVNPFEYFEFVEEV